VTWRREHHRLDYNTVGDDEVGRRAGDGTVSAVSSARKPVGTGGKKRPEDLRGTAACTMVKSGARRRLRGLELVSGRRPSSPVPHDDEASFGRVQPPAHIMDWSWRLYSEEKAQNAADAALGDEFDPAEVDRAVRLALACNVRPPKPEGEAVHADIGAGAGRLARWQTRGTPRGEHGAHGQGGCQHGLPRLQLGLAKAIWTYSLHPLLSVVQETCL
jgi:hypothetical protein